MLTAVLDRLTSLGSKHFVIGAFVPVLVFAFVNGALLYQQVDWFRRWADPQMSGVGQVFDAAAVAVALAVVAYVLWSLNPFLMQVLEGQHLHADSSIARPLREAQLERLRRLRQDYFDARTAAAQIASRSPNWKARLTSAAQKGMVSRQPNGQPVLDKAGKPVPNPTNTYDENASQAALAIAALRDSRARAETIKVRDIEAAVAALSTVLEKNNITLARADGSNPLADHRSDLQKLFDYAADVWGAREVALAAQLQGRYGEGDVAPTAFGNVAGAMQAYARTRYGINLATFWSRLQPVLQKDAAFYGVLQDAKAQLDFLVASFWLSAVTTAIWVVALPWRPQATWLFVAAAVLGPLVARFCYVAAVENYVAFGEIVRTGIDLHRFELLDELHIARPISLRQERQIWESLQRVTSYGQEWVDIGYQQPPKAKA